MPTHVALLRGVNVGGHNRISMPDLRRVASGIGLEDVATYVQSGNLVFTTTRDPAKVARELESSLASDLGVECDVVVLTQGDLVRAVEANPFPVSDPKCLHLVFRSRPLDRDEVKAVEAAVAKASEKGGSDRAEVVGATVYLHTPNGLGRSDLAARLSRSKSAGTARNWSTVSKLLALLDT